MIFASLEFILFFGVVLGVRSLLRSHSAGKWFLLAASYVFYMSWSIPCVLIILATSLIDFGVGLQLGKTQDRQSRRWWIAVSLIGDLGILGFFKYTNFLTANAGWALHLLGFDTSGWRFDIVLPVGISFFTFQSMSYTIDVYRGQIPPCRNLRDYLLFVAFFPQLVAGPIVRAKDFLPQLIRRARPSAADLESGWAQFLLGAVKKLVISDQIAGNVDLIFANPGVYDGSTLLQGALGYAVQIYCDFSGYSDMAIGAARIMGFHFPENFQMPYTATNISDFWRRWHISLSSWFRDYVYIALGGNRRGSARTYANLFLTMLLCGLWHGASWNFVFWGGIHGVALAVHRAWTRWSPASSAIKRKNFHFARMLFSRVATLGVVLVGWVFFRAQSWGGAWEYLTRMVGWTSEGTRFLSPYIMAAVVSVGIIHLLVRNDGNWALELAQKSIPIRLLTYTALLCVLVSFGATDSAPFIYFQF